MKRIILWGILIIVTLILLVVHRERSFVRESSSEMSASSVQVNEKKHSKSEETNTFETTQSVPRFRYKHNSSPFPVDGGGFARFEIDHGLKELSWQESHRRNSQARRFGKRGKITLNIVDLEGSPIPNAKVHYFFNISDDTSVHATHVYTETDENGILSLEGRSIDYVYFIVSKEGYYDTKHFYSFLVRKHDCYEGGRWIPWNPTLEVTLKPILNPVKRMIQYAHIVFPERNKPFGFDCEVNDLVEPYGKGIVSDFELTFYSDLTPDGFQQSRFTNEVYIVSKSSNRGFKKEPLDRYCPFPYRYEPPNGLYENELYFLKQWSGQGVSYLLEVNPFNEGYYYVMRLRESYDENGNVTSVHYGKMIPREFAIQYDPKNDTVHLKFCFYYNPVANDRNMEGEDDYRLTGF